MLSTVADDTVSPLFFAFFATPTSYCLVRIPSNRIIPEACKEVTSPEAFRVRLASPSLEPRCVGPAHAFFHHSTFVFRAQLSACRPQYGSPTCSLHSLLSLQTPPLACGRIPSRYFTQLAPQLGRWIRLSSPTLFTHLCSSASFLILQPH